jgi:hypothetical protein
MSELSNTLDELAKTTQLAAAAVALAAFAGRPTASRERLLELRSRIDELLGALPAKALPATGARFMTCPAFAQTRGLSDRTIRDYCELGMPHSGEGRGRRVLVAAAIAWIDDGGPARARMARKKG